MPTRILRFAAKPAPVPAAGRFRGRILAGLALAVLAATPAAARDRFGAYPAVEVAPDLAAEWLLQLSPGSGVVPGYKRPHLDRPGPAARESVAASRPRVPEAGARDPGAAPRGAMREHEEHTGLIAAVSAPATAGGRRVREMKRSQSIDPMFLPQVVDYRTREAPGTIVIDTGSKFLYRVEEGGKARRYGVGVGKPGFAWAGTHAVTRKQEWPTWTPPAQMRAREKKKGKILPLQMKGGAENPLGARAMYLGSTLYRIHGTNQPWSIGKAMSSGCIRMRNEDITDLYEQVAVGTRVIVL